MFPESRHGKMPGFKEHACDPIDRAAPSFLEIRGKKTLIIHASDIASAMVATGKQDIDEGAIANGAGTIATIISIPGQIGLVYTMTTEAALSIGQSLVRLAELSEAHASQQAEAAFKKAAGK